MVLEERLSQARGRVIAPAQIVVAAALVTPGDRLVGDPPLKYPSERLRLHAHRPVRVLAYCPGSRPRHQRRFRRTHLDPAPRQRQEPSQAAPRSTPTTFR